MEQLTTIISLVETKYNKDGEIGRMILYLLFMIMIVVAYQIVLVVHEGGHAVFGILTGYKIIIFRIENIAFIQEEGRVHLKFYQSYGSAGQCVLCPPIVETGEDVPFALHTLGGIIGNIILSIISVVLFLCSSNTNYIVELFLALLFFISLLSALMNGIPYNGVAISNDGYNFKLLRNSAQTRKSLYYQLQIISKLCKGMTYKELPEEIVIVPKPSDQTNPILAWHQMISYYRYLDNGRWADAFEYLEEIEKYSCKYSKSLKYAVQAEKLFLMIKFELDFYEIEEIYVQIKKLIKNKKADFHLVKVQMAYEIYKKNNLRTRERIRAELKAKANTYPCKGDSLLCIKLIKGMMS
ncbi:MAG: hypothetical protein WBI07_19240 [Mobilitalea sp.]